MSERFFRIILGISLLLLLALEQPLLVYAFIGLLIFEGLTNWRVPILVSKLRYGANYHDAVNECSGVKINFEAERVLRLIVAVMLILTFVLFNKEAWVFPWFIGTMLLMAGLTNICPMGITLRWMGFR